MYTGTLSHSEQVTESGRQRACCRKEKVQHHYFSALWPTSISSSVALSCLSRLPPAVHIPLSELPQTRKGQELHVLLPVTYVHIATASINSNLTVQYLLHTIILCLHE